MVEVAWLWCTAAIIHVCGTRGAAMCSLQPGMCDVAGRHTVSLGQVLQARLRERYTSWMRWLGSGARLRCAVSCPCIHVLCTCGAAMYLLQPGMCDVAGRHTVSLGQVHSARLRELRQFVRAGTIFRNVMHPRGRDGCISPTRVSPILIHTSS